MKNTEVEIRGPLSFEQADRLMEKFRSFPHERHDRYMVNFTTEQMRSMGVDVRARVTCGITELVVKNGEWGSNVRKESIARCEGFMPLVHVLIAMNFTQGVGCRRVSDRFDMGEIELSIISVPGHSVFYEAEIVTDESGSAAAERRLLTWAGENGLVVYDKAGFLDYVDRLDREANDLLDFRIPGAVEIVRQKSFDSVNEQTSDSLRGGRG